MPLNSAAYTLEELIHYASIDDSFKPMLADRVIRDGLPEKEECDCADNDFVDEVALLMRDTQREWLQKITDVIAILEANPDVSSTTIEKLNDLFDDIETHETA